MARKRRSYGAAVTSRELLEHQRDIAAIDAQGRIGKSSEYARYMDKISSRELASKTKGANAEYLKGAAQMTSASLGVWAVVKPLLIGALILFFLIGPGISAFGAIFKSLNIWMWIGIIIVALLIWRNR